MNTFLSRPDRAPIEIPSLTSKYYTGGTVAEIGCAAGDFLPLWGENAKEVVGYELDEGRFAIASTRSDVVENSRIKIFNDLVSPETIVSADFYYGWSTDPSVVEFAERLKRGKKGKVFCCYGGIAPKYWEEKAPPPFALSSFKSQKELENWADELIYFTSQELDGRPAFDEHAKEGELIIAIKQLQ